MIFPHRLSLPFAVESGEGLAGKGGSVDVSVGFGVFLGVAKGVDVLLSHIGLGVVDGVEMDHPGVMVSGHDSGSVKRFSSQGPGSKS